MVFLVGYEPRLLRGARMGNLRGSGALGQQLGISITAIQRKVLSAAWPSLVFRKFSLPARNRERYFSTETITHSSSA